MDSNHLILTYIDFLCWSLPYYTRPLPRESEILMTSSPFRRHHVFERHNQRLLAVQWSGIVRQVTVAA